MEQRRPEKRRHGATIKSAQAARANGAREASLALVVPGIESKSLLRSTLDSLSAHIAVLDGHGTIVAVNKAWRQFARESGYVGHDFGVGLNYLSVCEAGAQLSREAAKLPQPCETSLRGVCAISEWNTRAPVLAVNAGFRPGLPVPSKTGASGSWWRTRTSPRSRKRMRSLLG